MHKKLAKLKYLANNFEIVEQGDHVICAVSGREINLKHLNYCNVELPDAYFSYKEAHLKNEELNLEIIRNKNFGLVLVLVIFAFIVFK